MARQRWRPVRRREPVPQPAAGANWSLRNDSGGLWQITGVVFVLTTSAAVANRDLRLDCSASTDLWFRTGVAATQAAGVAATFAAWPGSTAQALAGLTQLIAWPDGGLMMPPGHVLATSLLAIDAGDQFSAIIVDRLEYPEILPVHLIPYPSLYTEDSQE